MNLRNYRFYKAPVQLQLFEVWTSQPESRDPEAHLDGNVMFTDNARFADCSDTHRRDSEFEVVSNDVLQVSGVRNCQMITIKDNVADEHMIMVNLHLHNPAEKLELGDYLRGH